MNLYRRIFAGRVADGARRTRPRPGPGDRGAAAGLWTGYSLARKVLRASPPPPAATHDWHAMSVEQVRRLLPAPVDDRDVQPPKVAAVDDRENIRRRVRPVPARYAERCWEFATTLRDELSDPLTPILGHWFGGQCRAGVTGRRGVRRVGARVQLRARGDPASAGSAAAAALVGGAGSVGAKGADGCRRATPLCRLPKPPGCARRYHRGAVR